MHDLPAGGKRFLQKAEGYVGTWVAAGRCSATGRSSGERPGRLVRVGSTAQRSRLEADGRFMLVRLTDGNAGGAGQNARFTATEPQP